VQEKVPGDKHPNALASMSNLAQVLNSQGKDEAAEAMHKQTLTVCEKVLRYKHSDTLTSVYCLPYLLAN
jgi:hypothetical protein